MNKTQLHHWLEEVVQDSGFEFDEVIYTADYYQPGKTRALVAVGQYQGKAAALKLFDDPRLTDEPIIIIEFNKRNKSKILKAPEVYKFKIISAQKGWFIMEKLPDGSKKMKQPLDPKERKNFLNLYLEYRKNFPEEPTRPLILLESLPANEFHRHRINRWFELANNKEAELIMLRKQPVLKANDFIPRFIKGLKLIDQEFSKRAKIWSHGHFKPHDVFQAPGKDLYYLIDFAHTKMYPEGYELSLIIWADWLMSSDWRMDYGQWRRGVDEWIKEMNSIADELQIKDFNALIKASLVERIIGSILADVTASNRPREEKEKRIEMLMRLLDELLGW